MKAFWLIVIVCTIACCAGISIERHFHECPAPVTLETLPSQSWDANVSAYCPCKQCCGRYADGITASGKPAVGFFVAAPPNVPFGTLLSIPGYNEGLPVPVLDRGGAIVGNKLDVFFPTHQEALNWGRQYLKIKEALTGP